MNPITPARNNYTGYVFAVAATIIWAGNFVVARGIHTKIPPVSLAFYRWVVALIVMLPLAWSRFKQEKEIILRHSKYIFLVSLTGISVFNTLVYIAGKSTSAINMALIGTTSSPIFVMVIAAVFLKEKISLLRIIGVLLILAGILVLLSKGTLSALVNFRFSIGDMWVLTGAFSFAIYNLLVRKKPAAISAHSFLMVIFFIGAAILFPFYCIEQSANDPVIWDMGLVAVILYLGIGASVISFLLWNAAISKIGAVQTSLFGNLIPLFSALEAVWLLNEKITGIHLLSGVFLVAGLIISNIKKPIPATVPAP